MGSLKRHSVFVEIPYSPLREALWSGKSHRSDSPLKRKLDIIAIDENTRRNPGFAADKYGEGKPLKKKRVDVPKSSVNVVVEATKSIVSKPVARKKNIVVARCPKWTPIYGAGSREEVEDRVMCREFIKRFRNILHIPKTHVDSLDTFDSFSEPTCKALLIGLLDVIADDEPNHSAKHEISAVVKRLRGRQINLDQIWDAVHSLASSCLTVPLAGPSPSSGEAARTTRVTRKGPDLVQARQLIPVINSLISEAIQTSFIRQEFDDGVKEITRLNKERASRVKEEIEGWVAVRKVFTQEKENACNHITQSALTKEEKKVKHKIEQSALSAKLRPPREAHRIALLKLNVRHLTDVQSNQLRYEPLGVDHEGRTYHALSHPQSGGKGASANKHPSQSERNRLANWAYFVFVWGKRPADAPVEDASDQDGEELWWAFNEAATIRQLSNWLLSTVLAREEVSGQISTGDADQGTGGISTDKVMEGQQIVGKLGGLDKPTTESQAVLRTRALCKGLSDFADFLDVRFGTGDIDTSNGSTKGLATTSVPIPMPKSKKGSSVSGASIKPTP